MKPTALNQNRVVRLAAVALGGATVVFLAGCASEVVAPVPPPTQPTQTIIVQPAAAPQAVIGTAPVIGGGYVIAQAAPPVHPQQQVISARPTADHVWVEGWWEWREGRHVWRPGEWVIPPRRGAVWNAPRWERRSDGYVFVEGYWN